MNLFQLFLNKDIAEFRVFNVRTYITLQGPLQRTQKRTAFPHHKGQHISPLAAIVMPGRASLHGVPKLASLWACRC